MQVEVFQILRDFRQGNFTPIGNSVFDYLGHSASKEFLALIHPHDSINPSNGEFKNKPVGYAIGNLAGLRLQNADETWVSFLYTEALLEVLPTGDAAKTIISLFPSNHIAKIEQSLYESKERFRVLAEASFGGIGVHDKGKIIEANHELARMSGYEHSELIGMDGLLLIAQETRVMVMDKIVSGYEKPYEAKGIRKDGAIYSLEIQGKQVPYNGKMVRVTEFRNIDERKRTEETIRLGEERFKAIIEFAVDGIILGDSKGVVTGSNMRFLEISGFKREDVIGNHISKLFTSDTLSNKPLRFDLLLEGKTIVSEREILRPDGVVVYIEMHSKMMPDGSYQSIVRDISKRKLAEKELAKEQFLMHMLMENVPEQIYFKDTEGRFLRVNQSVANRFMLSNPDEAIGKSDFDFFTNEHASWAYKIEKEIIATGKPVFDIEEYQTWPDGRTTWVSTSKMPLLNNNGEIVGTFGVSRDITSKKQTEEALRKSEELFRLVVDATNDAIWDWNLGTKKSYFSDNYYTMLGYKPGEFESGYNSWKMLVHPDDIKWVEILTAKFIKENNSEIVLDFRMRMKNGDYKWIHSIGKIIEKDSNGEPLRIIGVHEDITERKKNEDAVKLERAYFEQLFESSPEGIVILDVNDKVIRCNREFTRIFGYANNEAVGKQINDLIVPRDLADEGLSLTHLVAKGNQIMRETIRMHKDGSSVHVSILGKPIHFEGGQIAVYGIYRDISDRKQVEEELVRKNYEIEAQNEEYRVLNEELQLAKEKAEESDRLKSAFLANMSHEVRTPMNGIIGFTQLLASAPVQQPEFNQYLGVIESCGNQLLTIINDLIDISKIEANQLTISEAEVNVNQVMQKQYLLFLQKANGLGVELKFETSLPDDACTVTTDGARLQQVLSNLIGNALKFTTQGSVTLGYAVKSNKIEFFVSDTGIGIPKAQQGYIFERFRQVDNPLTTVVGGTGLGLAISKALVNLMGGEISVDSEPNVGSTFSFTIPYKPVAFSGTEQLELPETEGVSIPKGKRVLIAEDDEFNYMYVRELLNELNVDYIRVANGAEAYDAVVNDSSIDLLLLDLKMPVMDGYEAARKIRQVNLKIPIIAQTAYAFSSDREKSLHAGCNDYISKPIDRREFERLLAKYLK
jgi:PAS domain S-box-containing protein